MAANRLSLSCNLSWVNKPIYISYIGLPNVQMNNWQSKPCVQQFPAQSPAMGWDASRGPLELFVIWLHCFMNAGWASCVSTPDTHRMLPKSETFFAQCLWRSQKWVVKYSTSLIVNVSAASMTPGDLTLLHWPNWPSAASNKTRGWINTDLAVESGGSPVCVTAPDSLLWKTL